MNKQKYRVVRGGSWYSDQWAARCAFRNRLEPDVFLDDLGFRLLKSSENTKSYVARGGSWGSGSRSVRSAYRVKLIPDSFNDLLSFRVVKPNGLRVKSP